MIQIFCFLNTLCSNPQGVQVSAPVVGSYNFFNYSYSYTLGSSTTVSLNASPETIPATFAYYNPVILSFEPFTTSTEFELITLPASIPVIEISNGSIISYTSFTIK